MGQKGRVIKGPLGPKQKRQRGNAEPSSSSQAVSAELAAVESQSALANAEELNSALAGSQHQQATQTTPDVIQQGHLDSPPSDAEINWANPNDGDLQPSSSLSPSSDTNETSTPPTPLPTKLPMSFGEYIRGAYYTTRNSVKTSQWGDRQTWDQDFNEPCACGVGYLRSRSLDLVDLVCREKKEIVFCDCIPDQVRLIRMGYIGGSPVHPETAFSIRLIRYHHTMWKHCTVCMQGFAVAHDEFLDPANPLILVPGTTQPRLWRKTLSGAVDAFRDMLLMKDELAELALDLSYLDKLASNCPRCFGSFLGNDEKDEPDYIVCVDGNFQHRRHTAASREYEERKTSYPSLFMDPRKVAQWAPGPSRKNKDIDVPDTCTAQHTAAADHRGASTWKGCDETGLIGMACRHDHILQFVNVVKSGEKQYYVLALLDEILEHTSKASDRPTQLGILYDIGCTLEKSIKKNQIFKTECENSQLKFGTSVFHSYVHRWTCQLEYNPRLNKGWGLSDGEGLERDWSYLSPLVMPNRYSTRQHRLNTLHLRSKHRNMILRANAVGSARNKLSNAQASFKQENTKLNQLSVSNTIYTPEYFANQWTRQKSLQMSAMSDETVLKFEEQLTELLDLEEKLRDSHNQLSRLQRSRIENRSTAEHEQVITLPGSIVALEEAIAGVVSDLGSEEFRNLTHAQSPKARSLIRVRIAKRKLYEAKVGILEAQKRWEKHGQGTRVQQSLKQFMQNKQSFFKRKFDTFKLQVSKYNSIVPLSELPCPLYDEAKGMSIEDPFWNSGALSHPNEAWAVDQGTKDGIYAFLPQQSCAEELRRIGREVRQMMLYALQTDEKLDSLRDLSFKDWDPECHGKDSPIDLVQPGGRQAKEVWNESRTILNAVYVNLRQSHSREWMGWNSHMVELLRGTSEYSKSTVEFDDRLVLHWGRLIVKCKTQWEINVNAPSLEAETLDYQEMLEQRMLLWGEEEEEMRVPREELEVDEEGEVEDDKDLAGMDDLEEEPI
ncbi:hypothetical protein DFH28DRAFT_1126225 [Melampsora americana]|nr:hypothetical protein DFH28DRAFT_1126225 [Melampsora americana]